MLCSLYRINYLRSHLHIYVGLFLPFSLKCSNRTQLNFYTFPCMCLWYVLHLHTLLLYVHWCCFPLLAGKGSRSKRSKVEESSESSTTEASSSSSDESSSESESESSEEEKKKKRRRRRRKKRQRKMKQLSRKEERKRKKRKREGKDKKSKGRAKKRKQEPERLVHILQQCRIKYGI